jgi:hypothetical protein
MFFSYLHSMSKMMKFWPIDFKSHSSYHSKFIKHLLLLFHCFALNCCGRSWQNSLPAAGDPLYLPGVRTGGLVAKIYAYVLPHSLHRR